MKKFCILLIALLLSASLFAQPQKMSYQAVLRNASNALVINSQIGMRISILPTSATGTAVYIETQTPTKNANGLGTIEIGGGTIVTGTFAGIDWSTGTYFTKTVTDPTSGTGYTITGTSQLLSVPSALYAKTAGTSDALQSQLNMLKISSAAGGTISDVDNNVYNTVKIGTQVWMAENLKTTKYNDGTAIPNITDNTAWATLTTGAYSDYSNTSSNSNTYGRLYNWYAVDNNSATKAASNSGKSVCPTGWHIPNDAEWTTLTTYLGGESVSGGKLKEIGLTHWITPNTGATNETGFTALPGGVRIYFGAYSNIGISGSWWSSNESSSTYPWIRFMGFDSASVVRSDSNKLFGFSVRCLRDN
jgi:uncharacterized protein (TIGR02145 family)